MRIKLNLFFILFLFSSFLSGWLEQSLILFASVLLHELGHVWAAKKMKIEVYEVELLPYGGVARMEDIAKFGGFAEALVAAAGPITSGIIALGSFFLLGCSIFFSFCMQCNLIIFIFNLLPVHPLDGGRIARNLLIFFMGYRQATRLLVIAGRLASLALLAYNIRLLAGGDKSVAVAISAVFIYIGTVKEERNASYYYLLLSNNRKKQMMQEGKIRKRFIKAHEDTKIRTVVNCFSPVTLCFVDITDSRGKVLRTLDEDRVVEGFMRYGYDGTMGQIKLQ